MRTAQAGFKIGKGGRTAADFLAEIGPTIRVDVGLKSRAASDQRPDLIEKGVHALIDTGAGMNGIDEDLARRLGLPPTEEGKMSGFMGPLRQPSTWRASTFRLLAPCCLRGSQAPSWKTAVRATA